MHLIGRYERVRPWGLGGLTADGWHEARLLDRKWGTMAPFPCEEWWKNPRTGMWQPTMRGGSATNTRGTSRWNYGLCNSSALSQTTTALNAVYLFGVTGQCLGIELTAPVSATLSNLYFFITSYTGTAANVNDIDVELRNDSSFSPSTTVHTSESKDPASATGWIKCSSLSPSFDVVAGTRYWICIGDKDFVATDSATVLRAVANIQAAGSGLSDLVGDRRPSSTTNGFSTVTLTANPPAFLMVFGDGSVFGQPFVGVGTPGSSTNRRGLLINAFTEQMKLWGYVIGQQASVHSGVELWTGTAGPSGSPTATATISLLDSLAGSNNPYGFAFSTPQTLAKATQYRVVMTYSGNGTTTRQITISDGNDANLKAAMLGGGGFYYTEASGTTDWSLDETQAWPQAFLIFEDQVAITSAAGGSPVIGAGSMVIG